MRAAPGNPSQPTGFLGIEAGGTRTTALWESDDGSESRPHQAGPANLQLINDRTLRARFREIARALPRPRAIGIGMAGARTERDRDRIRSAASRIWRGIPCTATHDLEIGLAAAAQPVAWDGVAARVMILSGTGSCCYGRSASGAVARTGGWGHLLGDEGSAHAIAHAALRLAIRQYDEAGEWGELGARVLAALHLNEPDALIPWIQGASKSDVAALTPQVFLAAAAGDRAANSAVTDAAQALARTALACADKLSPRAGTVEFVLAGGVLTGQPAFAKQVSRIIHRKRPRAPMVVLERPGAAGGIALARTLVTSPTREPAVTSAPARTSTTSPIPQASGGSPTEERNRASSNLDRMPAVAAFDLMLAEERRLEHGLRGERRNIVRALGCIVRAFDAGGRLFYVGAGTSGRLGVLDASECPPTFRTPPELVQGIIAGGATAVFRSVEGAEDDTAAGAASIRFRRVTGRDVVVGIAASGRTPFVWGALAEARRRGAKTILIGFNPHLRFAPGHRPDVVVTPRIGPEVLTGSTRLKAGTATKWILNYLSTMAMVRMGKVVGNLMVDLNPLNSKLRERAVRIVWELTQADESAARTALEDSGWVVKEALGLLGKKPAARRRSGARARR